MISQKKLAIAVSVALGATAAAVAHADSAYFPQVVYSPSVTTIISVVNESSRNYTPAGLPDGDNLHYRLYYKDLLAADSNLDACREFNTFLPTSKFDLQSFDVGNVFTDFANNTLGVLFDDPSRNNQWQQAGQSYALALDTGLSAIRGYLLVDNQDRLNPPGTTPTNRAQAFESVTGEALLMEYATGASWGYAAYDRDGDTAEEVVGTNVLGGEFDYGRNGENSGTASPYQVTMMPFEEVSTSFLVTPIYAPDQPGPTNAGAFNLGTIVGNVAPGNANDYEATLEFVTRSGAFSVYDRDELVMSGSVPETVVCVGRVEAQDLLTVGVNDRTRNGGWGLLENRAVLSQATPGVFPGSVSQTVTSAAVVIKHEAGTSLNGVDTNGRWNNAIILPDAGDND
jgi:hypothetical protein